MVRLTQLLHPRLPIIIPECLLRIRAPWRCVVHSAGLDKCIMTCIQFHCPEHPLCLSYISALPCVFSFRVTLVCSSLKQLLPLSRLSCPPHISRAQAWLCRPPHTWATSHPPGIDAGCTLGERHHRSYHPTSPSTDAPSSWGPLAVARGVLR